MRTLTAIKKPNSLLMKAGRKHRLPFHQLPLLLSKEIVRKYSLFLPSLSFSLRENERVKTIGTKTSGAFQSAGSAIKSTGTAIRDNERVQNFGERIRSTSVRIKVMKRFYCKYRQELNLVI